MQTLIWIIVGVVVIGGAVALVVVGSRAAAQKEEENDPLLARLAEFTERGETVSLEKLELSRPFS